MTMTVAIHQPLYLPWQAYFGKIISSDRFVFLDDVQYPGGKGFFNRNIIKGSNGAVTLTAPVSGRSSKPLVSEVLTDTAQNWQLSHWKSIQLSYAKAPYFSLYQQAFQDIYLNRKWTHLSELSTAIICRVCELLGAKTEFFWASKLVSNQSQGMDHLLDLIKALQANRYLTGSGEGSLRYMNEGEYAKNGIDVVWHEYGQQPYRQLWGEFLPDTCILDLLFNCGPQSLQILKDCSSVKNGK